VPRSQAHLDRTPLSQIAPPPRGRYGDEQHLEEALDKIFRFGKSGGVPRKNAPVLIGVREETQEGRYTLVLEFESKLEWDKWEERQAKFQSFFGPGEGRAVCVAAMRERSRRQTGRAR
jgi:hypothetical protein